MEYSRPSQSTVHLGLESRMTFLPFRSAVTTTAKSTSAPSLELVEIYSRRRSSLRRLESTFRSSSPSRAEFIRSDLEKRDNWATEGLVSSFSLPPVAVCPIGDQLGAIWRLILLLDRRENTLRLPRCSLRFNLHPGRSTVRSSRRRLFKSFPAPSIQSP